MSGGAMEFGDVRVELSNVDKVLYPATGTTKGEVIDYYLAIAAAMLPHIAGRPVTRKRWPNGVDEPAFFEKNLAAHAPAWLARHTLEHSQRPVTYPVIDTPAGLVWLGQQASLEVHVPQWRFDGDRVGSATRLVFDLDPGDGVDLADCAKVAVAVRDMVEQIGLRAFPVTSGSKGIHVYVPLDRDLTSGGASTVAKQVANNLESLYPELVTATMAKAVRGGKVFLDWSQNNPSKTTIAPYSLRGRAEPTAAAPRAWAELEDPTHLRHLRFDEVLARVRDDGDLLAGLDRGSAGTREPDRLTTYRSMRDPAKTPEPVPPDAPTTGADDKFVIQEHHAHRLHWDLRLERDGVLVSWAVPKGVPTSPSQNHLAVHTEDHPLEYLTFHGSIPKGEYGGGEMTIWDTGSYETEKWREDEVIVTLHGERVEARFALIRTGGKNWLMHLMKSQPATAVAAGAVADERDIDETAPPCDDEGDSPEGSGVSLPRGLSPMLATPGEVTGFDGDEWAFEVKWDGFRLIAEIDDGELTLRNRTGGVVTDRYPGLAVLADDLAGHRVVIDGEVVVFDENGISNFRLLQMDGGRAEFIAFDVLFLDGVSLLRKRYADRRRVLEALAAHAPSMVVVPQLVGNGAEVLAYSDAQGLEGVVAKRLDSVYLPGKRGRSWVKQKNWRIQQVVVGGWWHGKGEREGGVGSLLVGIELDGALRYAGRVGTGFSAAQLNAITAQLLPLQRSSCPFADDLTTDERREAVWVEPTLRAEVRYLEWTETGRLRHPAFVRFVD